MAAEVDLQHLVAVDSRVVAAAATIRPITAICLLLADAKAETSDLVDLIGAEPAIVSGGLDQEAPVRSGLAAPGQRAGAGCAGKIEGERARLARCGCKYGRESHHAET